MKKELGIKTAVFPMPVLMIGTYDENGKVNVMNAAWGQMVDYDKIILSLTKSHKTCKNLVKTRAFTVALADREHIAEADYFGLVSGNKEKDKFEKSGLHAVRSEHVNAPVIEEFPLVMECEVHEIIDNDYMYAVVGTIVHVQVEESALNENGKVDPVKMGAVMFNQYGNDYYTVGEKIADAWNAGKKFTGK